MESSFNLLRAAEALLEDAKRLTATDRSEGKELMLRRRIAQTAKKIALETGPQIDLVKSEWVVVSRKPPLTPLLRQHLTLPSSPTTQHATSL